MNEVLQGKNIIILVANGFAENDMPIIQKALIAAGALQKTVSVEVGLVNSWAGDGWGHYFTVDAHVSDILSVDFDGIVVLGGSRSVDKLSENLHTGRILSGFIEAGKPVALMGDAENLLKKTGCVAGDTVLVSEDTEQIIFHLAGSISMLQQAA